MRISFQGAGVSFAAVAKSAVLAVSTEFAGYSKEVQKTMTARRISMPMRQTKPMRFRTLFFLCVVPALTFAQARPLPGADVPQIYQRLLPQIEGIPISVVAVS